MSLDASSAQLTLPERLDRSASIEFKNELDAVQGQSLSLDGAGTAVIGGLGLQLLHKAKSHWTSSGWQFEITNPSEVLTEALSWLPSENSEELGES